MATSTFLCPCCGNGDGGCEFCPDGISATLILEVGSLDADPETLGGPCGDCEDCIEERNPCPDLSGAITLIGGGFECYWTGGNSTYVDSDLCGLLSEVHHLGWSLSVYLQSGSP